MKSISFIGIAAAIALIAPNAAASCCQQTATHSHNWPVATDHHHNAAPQRLSYASQTTVSLENGVRVIRPQPREKMQSAAGYAQWQDHKTAERRKARRIKSKLAYQADRIDELEDRITDLESERREETHNYGFVDGYGYRYPRPVYSVCDSRFAGPYGCGTILQNFRPGTVTVRPVPRRAVPPRPRPHKRRH